MAHGIENKVAARVIPLKPVTPPASQPAGRSGATPPSPAVDRSTAQQSVAFRSRGLGGSGLHDAVPPHALARAGREIVAEVDTFSTAQLVGTADAPEARATAVTKGLQSFLG